MTPPKQDAPAATTQSAEPAAPATGAADTAQVGEDELEAVVRAWSEALNAGDNEAAADLFAPGAIVIQGGLAIQLDDRAAAVEWNARLPCSGTIVDLEITEGIVVAVFSLGDRTTGPCDAAPGTLAAAAFLIENGKISVWQQVPPPEDTAPDRAAASAAPASPRAAWRS